MAVNIDGNGLIALGGTSSTQGRLRLAEDTDNGTNYIELTAPASVGSDRVITFPDATTTVVGTDTTQTLTNKSIVATQLTGTIAAARLPAGSALQVVLNYTNTQVEASFASSTDLGLSVSITPSSASSKVLVIVQCAGCGSRDTSTNWQITLRRNSTELLNFASYIGAGQGSGQETYPNTVWLDSPNTTSAVSYNLRGQRQDGSANCYFNHARAATTSTIVAMEIAG